ncbi:MAG: sulfite reductase subunit alpha [Janthinobacterium lividum]
MNAMSPPIPLIPDTSPFSGPQRAWLNGFLAGLYGSAGSQQPMALDGAAVVEEDEDFPWHDPALEMDERLSMAAGKPLRRTLMAAMAQLDCGQCGYLCQTYAEALADGKEASTSLCVPGAKPTQRKIKELMAAAPAAAAPTVAAPVAAPVKVLTTARVLSATRLTAEGSAKDVRHVVIDLAGSGLVYEAGDSIGIAAQNDPELVEATLRAMGATGEESVACPDGEERPLRAALASQFDIARPMDRTTDLLAMSATHAPHAAQLRRLSDGEDNVEPVDADLLDLLEAFQSARPPAVDLARSLPALKPRLYSIASSLKATPGQVHLCVGVVRATRRGRVRQGIASAFLAHRAADHGPIPVSVTTSHFRLPTDPAKPVIMCGPGTGIAPFRAFLQERAALGIKGRSWLFFGDQHAASDFLFEGELRGWLADGTLGRLDTAWSRDQAKKVYVQDRMLENSEDLWRWLQDGASFYICGDASRMAKDVDGALRRIAMTQGKLDEAQAKDWIVALARQGRYQRDVY